jgi:SpoVK/Ycf46/Vps4 family AAA+-type ATPase
MTPHPQAADQVVLAQIHGIPLKLMTLSGLLNVIDGISAYTKRLLIMTAKGPRSLDPALRRPGRVDETLKLVLRPK